MKISGYTTTRNSVEMNYPFKECILSMLDFCDEVVVVDSTDHDDGTLEVLEEMMDTHPKLEIVHVDVDYSVPNYGVWDGKLKAIARSNCTGEYLWQMDCDEIVHPNMRKSLENLINLTMKKSHEVKLMALPIVEYWGSAGKIRVDVNPWKWRLSKNDPTITHGIPVHLRKHENGLLYAKHGTDGCDYIHVDTGEIIPCGHFMTEDVELLRRTAVNDDPVALKAYQDWFNLSVGKLPTVYHFSWWSVAEKIRKYQHTWNKQWLSFYNEQRPDDWNPFFDQDINTVTPAQIDLYAKVIERETGGHIFHTKWIFTKTAHVLIDQKIPKFIEPWIKKITPDVEDPYVVRLRNAPVINS